MFFQKKFIIASSRMKSIQTKILKYFFYTVDKVHMFSVLSFRANVVNYVWVYSFENIFPGLAKNIQFLVIIFKRIFGFCLKDVKKFHGSAFSTWHHNMHICTTCHQVSAFSNIFCINLIRLKKREFFTILVISGDKSLYNLCSVMP